MKKTVAFIQQPNRELEIKVKPSDIPESFDVDISELDIGDTLTVADIREKSKYEILNEDEYALVTISAPRSAAELEALDELTEDASAEPEVIGEKEKKRNSIQWRTGSSVRLFSIYLTRYRSLFVFKEI